MLCYTQRERYPREPLGPPGQASVCEGEAPGQLEETQVVSLPPNPADTGTPREKVLPLGGLWILGA